MLEEGEAAIVTLAATLVVTVIVKAFEVTGDADAQALLEVITQVTAFPLARVVDV
jgi:hypothetical protein